MIARRVFAAMGTEVELLVDAPCRGAEAELDTAEAEIHRLEALLSRFREDSELSQLNRRGSLYLTSPAYVTHTAERSELLWRAGELFAALEAGIVKLDVGRRYPLAEAARAHEDLQGRRTSGVSILVP